MYVKVERLVELLGDSDNFVWARSPATKAAKNGHAYHVVKVSKPRGPGRAYVRTLHGGTPLYADISVKLPLVSAPFRRCKHCLPHANAFPALDMTRTVVDTIAATKPMLPPLEYASQTPEEVATIRYDHSRSVDAPAHYASGDEDPYEAIKVMLAWHGVEATRWFCQLNAEKYLARAGKKVLAGAQTVEGATTLDLRKAAWYAEAAANLLEYGEVRK